MAQFFVLSSKSLRVKALFTYPTIVVMFVAGRSHGAGLLSHLNV